MIARIALGLALLCWGATAQVLGMPSGQGVLRPPAGAGEYYPAEPFALQQTVRKLFEESPGNTVQNRLLAVVVPHAPFGLAGSIIASGLKSLQAGQYDRVVVLGPSQDPGLQECSIADVEAYVTPLGVVPVDTVAVEKLCYSPFIKEGKLYQRNQQTLHQKNMSIEVVLPFLQERIGVFRLVPIVMGDLMSPPLSEAAGRIAAVADAIREIMDERTLLVVTCNFTHYGEVFGYTPFGDARAEKVRKLDEDIFGRMIAQDGKALAAELKRTENHISGLSSIEVLLALMPDNASAAMVAYDTTGNKTGHWENSLSLASLIYTHPSAPAPETKPERKLLELSAPVAMPEKKPEAPPVVEAPAEGEAKPEEKEKASRKDAEPQRKAKEEKKKEDKKEKKRKRE